MDPNLIDKGGAPFVRYGRLVEEVEGVFGVKELERKPECDVDASIKAAKVCFLGNTGEELPQAAPSFYIGWPASLSTLASGFCLFPSLSFMFLLPILHKNVVHISWKQTAG